MFGKNLTRIYQTFPAGRYLIGDPCYIFDGDTYDTILKETRCFGLEDVTPDYAGGVFNLPWTNKKFAVLNTSYGDGCYSSSIGKRFPVDAGCIACVPVTERDGKSYPEIRPGYEDSIVVVDIPNTFEPSCENGTLVFDSVEIYTGDDPYYDEDVQEDYYFDDENTEN